MIWPGQQSKDMLIDASWLIAIDGTLREFGVDFGYTANDQLTFVVIVALQL